MTPDRSRPLGRLSRWPLPEHDHCVAYLTEETRLRAGHIWLQRVQTEARAIDGFTRLAAELEQVGAEPIAVSLAHRAIDDERRHAELCRQIASLYLGRQVPEPPPLRSPVPEHPGAPEEILPTLHAVALCCMQETTSSTYIEACLREATTPMARAVLRELLADEIDHARIGWAHLGSPLLSAEHRAAVGPWLLPLARASFHGWHQTAPFAPEQPQPPSDDADLLAHGCGGLFLGNRAAITATRSLIAPGLREAGFVIPALDDWIATLPSA